MQVAPRAFSGVLDETAVPSVQAYADSIPKWKRAALIKGRSSRRCAKGRLACSATAGLDEFLLGRRWWRAGGPSDLQLVQRGEGEGQPSSRPGERGGQYL